MIFGLVDTSLRKIAHARLFSFTSRVTKVDESEVSVKHIKESDP